MSDQDSLAQHEAWLLERAPNPLGPEGMSWGWAHIKVNDAGEWTADGTHDVRDIWWVHRCSYPNGSTPLVLGRLDIHTGDRHELIQEDPLTVHGGSGSVICRTCGTHGYIREGRWVAI